MNKNKYFDDKNIEKDEVIMESETHRKFYQDPVNPIDNQS